MDSHNTFRARHNVPRMFWNQRLADGAQTWADFLLQNGTVQHDNSIILTTGENIAVFRSIRPRPLCRSRTDTLCLRCRQVVTAWYNEISNYNFSSGGPIDPNQQWLHFTQVVWRASTRLGVGVASGQNVHYIVARYRLRGNLGNSEDFERNVPRLLPTGT